MSAHSATRKQVELNRELKDREMRRFDRILADTDRADHLGDVISRIRRMLHSAKRLTPDQQHQLIEIMKEHVERLYADNGTRPYVLKQLGTERRAA